MNKSMIHYRFSFEKKYKTIVLQKEALTLCELEDLIESTIGKSSKVTNFDLEITNADTNKIIRNKTELIYKNTYLIVRRILSIDQVNTIKSLKKCQFCNKTDHESKSCNAKCTILRPPSGIPRSFYIVGPDKKISTGVELFAKNAATNADQHFFEEDENDSNPTLNNSSSKDNLSSENENPRFPREFKCAFGNHIMQDAVSLLCCKRFNCCNWCFLNRIVNDDSTQCVDLECKKDVHLDDIDDETSFELRKKIQFYLSNQNRFKNNC